MLYNVWKQDIYFMKGFLVINVSVGMTVVLAENSEDALKKYAKAIAESDKTDFEKTLDGLTEKLHTEQMSISSIHIIQ